MLYLVCKFVGSFVGKVSWCVNSCMGRGFRLFQSIKFQEGWARCRIIAVQQPVHYRRSKNKNSSTSRCKNWYSELQGRLLFTGGCWLYSSRACYHLLCLDLPYSSSQGSCGSIHRGSLWCLLMYWGLEVSRHVIPSVAHLSQSWALKVHVP